MQPSPQFLFQGCWVGFSWWLKVCHSSQVRDIEVKSATLGVRELSFVFAGDYCNYIWFLNSSSAISAPQISLNSSTPGRWLYAQKWLSCELMLESPWNHRKWHSFDSFVFCTCSLNDRLVISFLTTQSHKYLQNWISWGIFWCHHVIEQLHLKFSRFPLLQSLSTYHRLRYLDAAEWWPEACPPKEGEKMEWEEPSWYLLDRGVGDSLRAEGGKGLFLKKWWQFSLQSACLLFFCFLVKSRHWQKSHHFLGDI